MGSLSFRSLLNDQKETFKLGRLFIGFMLSTVLLTHEHSKQIQPTELEKFHSCKTAIVQY